MNKELLFLTANSIVNSIDYLKEYFKSCPENQKEILSSMLESLKNMGNAICDIVEEKNINNNIDSINITDEIMSYIKEIKEEIQREKNNE